MARRSPGRTAGDRPAREWIAGQRLAPFYVMEPAPHRPFLLLWMDSDSGMVAGMEVVSDALGHEATADVFVRIMGNTPGYVGPTRPRAVRIDDENVGAQLRSRLGPDVTLHVAPTPELDEVIAVMRRSMGPGDSEPAYIETADTPPATVGRFFAAAHRLGRLAPWRIARDAQVFRLDAPAFDVGGAVVSIIGTLGQNLGFIVFDSPGDYRTFLTFGDLVLDGIGTRMAGPGVRLFTVNFEPVSKLPAPMRQEALRHGWPASTREPWPWIICSDVDGVRRPVGARDYDFATACVQALTLFFERHTDIFERPPATPVREDLMAADVPGRPVVTLTAPHPDLPWEKD